MNHHHQPNTGRVTSRTVISGCDISQQSFQTDPHNISTSRAQQLDDNDISKEAQINAIKHDQLIQKKSNFKLVLSPTLPLCQNDLKQKQLSNYNSYCHSNNSNPFDIKRSVAVDQSVLSSSATSSIMMMQSPSKLKPPLPPFKGISPREHQPLKSGRCTVPMIQSNNSPRNEPIFKSPQKIPRQLFKLQHNSPEHQTRKLLQHNNSSANKQTAWTLDNFILMQQLDKGKFGIVYLAREKNSNVQVAIKAVKKDHILRQGMHTQLRTQIQIHTRLYHSNIIRMYGYFHDDTRVYMVMQYSPFGSLFKQLGHRKSLTQSEAASVIYQLCDATNYLHNRNVIHRDIKPQNVLISCQSPLVIKLCDFGWAAHAVNERRQTFCGTVDYVAPQIARKDNYGPEIDIWCIGILLYQLLTGRPPFLTTTDKETFDKIKKQQYVLPSYLSLQAISLIKSVLVEGSKRLSLEQIMVHEFMVKNLEIREGVGGGGAAAAIRGRQSLPSDIAGRISQLNVRSIGSSSSSGNDSTNGGANVCLLESSTEDQV